MFDWSGRGSPFDIPSFVALDKAEAKSPSSSDLAQPEPPLANTPGWAVSKAGAYDDVGDVRGVGRGVDAWLERVQVDREVVLSRQPRSSAPM